MRQVGQLPRIIALCTVNKTLIHMNRATSVKCVSKNLICLLNTSYIAAYQICSCCTSNIGATCVCFFLSFRTTSSVSVPFSSVSVPFPQFPYFFLSFRAFSSVSVLFPQFPYFFLSFRAFSSVSVHFPQFPYFFLSFRAFSSASVLFPQFPYFFLSFRASSSVSVPFSSVSVLFPQFSFFFLSFRAFSSVVRQMPGYSLQRRGTARTLPN